MKLEKVINVLEHEKECVLRNIRNKCDRDCAKCDLVLPDFDIINAYNYTLSILNSMRKDEQ